MEEVDRVETPPTVILQRDGVRLGFATFDGNPSQDGAVVLTTNITTLKEEFESKGVSVGNWRVDEQDGKQFQVFFFVAPDELCYYFHEPFNGDA